ncbi:MAG: alanine/glycine:cation symporter family protein [Candidatus Oxydemutatoraceae bacterium WSBS_2016_MAG_OTU14]
MLAYLSDLSFSFELILIHLNNYLWTYFVPISIPLVSLMIMWGLKFAPLRYLGSAIREAMRKKDLKPAGEITPFQALASSVGTSIASGNIIGVSVAIFLGGPGAVFWMWMTAFLCMAIKYAEIVLAVHFRELNAEGVYMGGPFYYIRNGLHKKWHFLAPFFAISTIIAGLGAGSMGQGSLFTDSMQLVLQPLLEVPNWVVSVPLTILVAVILIGGIRRIAAWATRITLFMTTLYILIGIYFAISHWQAIPAIIALIMQAAFSETAAVGGFAGATIWAAIRAGMERSLFSNESGFGTVCMIHATAKTNDPARQGLIGMLGNLIDTVVVCSITAFIILASNAWQMDMAFSAISVVNIAFDNFLPGGQYFISSLMLLFSFTTLLGWTYYCENCFYALFGHYYVNLFRIAWLASIVVGASFEFDFIWLLSSATNVFMVLPNLFAILLLSPIVFYLTRQSIGRLRSENA